MPDPLTATIRVEFYFCTLSCSRVVVARPKTENKTCIPQCAGWKPWVRYSQNPALLVRFVTWCGCTPNAVAITDNCTCTDTATQIRFHNLRLGDTLPYLSHWPLLRGTTIESTYKSIGGTKSQFEHVYPRPLSKDEWRVLCLPAPPVWPLSLTLAAKLTRPTSLSTRCCCSEYLCCFWARGNWLTNTRRGEEKQSDSPLLGASQRRI